MAAAKARRSEQLKPTLGVKFVSAGTAACIADLITYPLDTSKVRLQLQGETVQMCQKCLHNIRMTAPHLTTQPLKYRGITGTMATIGREEGFRALYNGLVPGLQRQMCFASVRIGLYDTVKQFYMDVLKVNGKVSPFNPGLCILAGVTTGGTAVLCAQPTDVVKVRLQAQTKLTARYKGTIHAYKTIAAEEGIRGLWKGTLPNITRNGIVNAAELVSYDLIKQSLLRRQLLSDSMPCHFLSAFGAGFFATIVASPVDVVKTRFMNSSPGTYKGALQCAGTMYRENGASAFYKGFVPSFMRLGSWNIVMFVCFEQIKKAVMEYKTRDVISAEVTTAQVL